MPKKQSTLGCNLKINFKYNYKYRRFKSFSKFIWKLLKMVQGKYFVFWYAIGNTIFYCESILFQNHTLYGAMTHVYPKSSCFHINEIHFVSHCRQACMANIDIYYMLSYNREQQACLCCVDFSGNEITDPSWNTYEISKYSPPLSFSLKR